MIKTIIFDFDQTMYFGKTCDMTIYNRYLFETSYGKNKNYDEFVKKYKINENDIKEIFDACKLDGLDITKYAKNQAEYVFEHTIEDKLELLPNEFYKALATKYNLYIASMSQMKYIKHYMKKYNIDFKCFKNISCFDLLNQNSKADIYKEIMKAENVSPAETLMVGDDIIHDIIPAKQLKIKTFQINKNYDEFYEFLTQNKILDCTKFKNIKKYILSDGKEVLIKN